jgi:hypothetical protein
VFPETDFFMAVSGRLEMQESKVALSFSLAVLRETAKSLSTQIFCRAVAQWARFESEHLFEPLVPFRVAFFERNENRFADGLIQSGETWATILTPPFGSGRVCLFRAVLA